MNEATGQAGAAAPPNAVEELRALGLLLLDRLDPLVARLTEGDHQRADGEPCTSCPFCAAVAGLRGEHADTAAAVARHTAGLIAALRAALAQAGTAPAPTGGSAPASGRVVQRIPVERVPPAGGPPSC
jgi:hypothetical protein